MNSSVRIAAVAAATALAGALGIASAQNSATDQGSQTTPAQVEVDNGNKIDGSRNMNQRHQPSAATSDMSSSSSEAPKADRN